MQKSHNFVSILHFPFCVLTLAGFFNYMYVYSQTVFKPRSQPANSDNLFREGIFSSPCSVEIQIFFYCESRPATSNLCREISELIFEFFHGQNFLVNLLSVPYQQNIRNWKIFAVAFAFNLPFRYSPHHTQFIQETMRTHLAECIRYHAPILFQDTCTCPQQRVLWHIVKLESVSISNSILCFTSSQYLIVAGNQQQSKRTCKFHCLS